MTSKKKNKIAAQKNILITKKIDFIPPSNKLCWERIDFIKVNTKKFLLPNDLRGKTVVITSQNAVRGLIEYYPNEKLAGALVYCVGEKTKAALEENGIKVQGVEFYSKTIAKKLVNDANTKAIVLFCGNLRRTELKEAALNNKIDYAEVEVYETTLIPKQMDKIFDGIVFLSPSAVQAYVQKNNNKNSVAFCIGTSTSKEASKYFNQVLISDDLTIESVLIKVSDYYGD